MFLFRSIISGQREQSLQLQNLRWHFYEILKTTTFHIQIVYYLIKKKKNWISMFVIFFMTRFKCFLRQKFLFSLIFLHIHNECCTCTMETHDNVLEMYKYQYENSWIRFCIFQKLVNRHVRSRYKRKLANVRSRNIFIHTRLECHIKFARVLYTSLFFFFGFRITNSSPFFYLFVFGRFSPVGSQIHCFYIFLFTHTIFPLKAWPTY